MTFKLKYHFEVVREDIPKLGKSARRQIKKALEDKLMREPEVFGKPLRKSLKGYRTLRVSDYRVIFRIEGKVVRIFIIVHRSKVYEEVAKRM